MQLDVQWQTIPRATFVHALRLIAQEVPRIEHTITSMLEPWRSPLRDLGLSQRFWHELLSTASVDVELSRAVGEAARRSRHAGPIAAVTQVFEAAEQEVARSDVDLSEELRLRQRPLREIWEASGPGMLFQVGRWTMRSISSRFNVQGLLPLCGGFGQPFAETMSVQIELVLANPVPEVPEVIRLAWLIAHLSIPSDANIPADRLALTACCLAAAEQLGLAQCQPATLAKSLHHWRLVDQGEDEMGTKLHHWWNHRDEGMPWSQATAQLQDLLST